MLPSINVKNEFSSYFVPNKKWFFIQNKFLEEIVFVKYRIPNPHDYVLYIHSKYVISLFFLKLLNL